MKILVTGAAGFIGVALCRQLVATGHEVRALWHRQRRALDGLSQVESIQADIRDFAQILSGCQGADAVCHLAVAPPGAPESAQINIQGTANVVEACRRCGVGRLVYASSMSVYDFMDPHYLPVDEGHPCQPRQEYGREKLRGETLCLEGGDPAACAMRLAGVFGPGKARGAAYAFTRAILAEEPVEIAADRTIDLLYVDDAAQALALALAGAVTGVLNIGSGAGCRLSELAGRIGQYVGQSPRIECAGAGDAFYLDIARAQGQLNYQPMTLDAALARFIPWVRQHADN